MIGAMGLVPTLCLLKLSKLGLVLTAVGQAPSPGEHKWALFSRVFCALQLAPAMSMTGIDKAQTLSELSFASVSG